MNTRKLRFEDPNGNTSYESHMQFEKQLSVPLLFTCQNPSLLNSEGSTPVLAPFLRPHQLARHMPSCTSDRLTVWFRAAPDRRRPRRPLIADGPDPVCQSMASSLPLARRHLQVAPRHCGHPLLVLLPGIDLCSRIRPGWLGLGHHCVPVRGGDITCGEEAGRGQEGREARSQQVPQG